MSSTNPNQKTYKFVFTAHVKTVSLAIKFPCVVSIVWKRGDKASQIKQRKPIEKGIITFNEDLQIECNMVYDQTKKKFQEKKTKFNILIYSQKGNKQAGQVHYDVAEFLNSESKNLNVEKTLANCPDKNAKLYFSLTGYMKQQISPDLVSKRSEKTYDIEATLNSQPVVKPDFKKKKNQAVAFQNNIVLQKQQATQQINRQKQANDQNPSATNLSKQNVSKLKLLDQNKRLKQELNILKQLELENENLKRKYEQADKKAQSYYKKKYHQMKQELSEAHNKNQQLKQLMHKKEQLQNDYCSCKEKIGKIFNYSIMNNNQKLMQFLQTQNF